MTQETTAEQVAAQRDAYLAAHYAAKDALQKRLTFLAERMVPDSGHTNELEAAALLVTLQMVGEKDNINSAAIPASVMAIADQLSTEALLSTDIRAIAGNAAYQRGLAHMLQAFDLNTQTNDAEQDAIAQLYVTAALEVGPQKSMYLCTLAQLSMQVRENEEAYRYAEAAVQEDPSNGEALRFKGNAAWALDRNDEAEALLKDSLRVAPYLDGTRQALTMILAERAQRDGVDLVELLTENGLTLAPYSPEEVVERVRAMSGPTVADQLLYDSIIHNQMAPRLTPDAHVLIDFHVEKKGVFSGKGRIRAHGVCNDGSPFYMMSANDWSVFGGFLGTKLFAQLLVPPPQSKSKAVEDVLDAAIDFMVMMREHLSVPG